MNTTWAKDSQNKTLPEVHRWCVLSVICTKTEILFKTDGDGVPTNLCIWQIYTQLQDRWMCNRPYVILLNRIDSTKDNF